MYCPKCSLQIADDAKFCRKCGANLRGIQDLIIGRNPNAFDWNKSWVTEMMLSGEEHERRKEERQRRRGITPEINRLNEVKAGVILSSIGIGAMIFLYQLLGAVALNEPPGDAMIMSKVWLAGLVPFMIGLALIFNGIVIGKRMVKLRKEQQTDLELTAAKMLTSPLGTAQLPEAEPYTSPNFSITETPTYRLPAQPKRDPQ